MRGRQLKYLADVVFLIQFFGEWGFYWRGFSSWRDFFSFSLVFGMDIGCLLSSEPKNIYFYRGFPLGQTSPSGLTNHRSFCILFLLFDWSASQMCWSTSAGRVSLPRIKFRLIIQSNHNIGAWLIKDPSPYFLGEVFFFTLTKTKIKNLIF